MEYEKKICAECKHFYQHYTRRQKNKYYPVAFGHCGEPRIRVKRPDAPACQRFHKQ